MTKKDLWPNFDNLNNDSIPNNSLDIIRNQASLLGEKTKGALMASFERVDYTVSSIEQATDTLRIISDIVHPLPQEIEDQALIGKADINDWFKTTRYRFSLYNETYKFRVFDLIYSREYPITLQIDEGIRTERKLGKNVEIDSDRDLEEILENILSSKKVLNIIRIMMKK